MSDRCLPHGGGPLIGLTVSAAMWGGIFALAGCASAPKPHKYSWGRIVRADANTLAQFCSDAAGKWDNGTEKIKWAPVAGCFDPASGDIWIEDSCQGAQSLLHELAHKDGVADPDSEGYEW